MNLLLDDCTHDVHGFEFGRCRVVCAVPCPKDRAAYLSIREGQLSCSAHTPSQRPTLQEELCLENDYASQMHSPPRDRIEAEAADGARKAAYLATMSINLPSLQFVEAIVPIVGVLVDSYKGCCLKYNLHLQLPAQPIHWRTTKPGRAQQS